MTVDNTPVTPDELHAFVDGELPADRQECGERLARDASRTTRLWSPPGARRPMRSARAMARPRTNRFRNASRSTTSSATAGAAGAALSPPRPSPRSWRLSVGGVAGWMARGASASAPSDVESFTNDALAAHRLYIGEVRHPIEVGAAEAHLLPWLSRRLGTADPRARTRRRST